MATVPVCGVMLLHILCAPEGTRPTGFVHHDQAYYMMNARATYESGTFPLYRLPFSADYGSPAIYFQPLAVILGGIVQITHVDPGVVHVLFGLLSAVVMFRLACTVYDSFERGVGSAAWLGRGVFLWGGGILVLAGALTASPAIGLTRGETYLRFDPFQGYWFLNLGRNAFYSTEAFYHAVFFGAILCLMRRRYQAVLGLMVLESLSHPFTGIQLLLIVLTFSAFERVVRASTAPPVWFAATAAAIASAHLGYYVFLLKALSPEHNLVEQQWSLAWTLPLSSMALAYGPVAAFALAGFARGSNTVHDSRVRLALAWLVVSLLLAKHEWFISPRQPLHFTRGYIWTALALLASPAFESLLNRLIAHRMRLAGIAAAAAIALLAVSDNAFWFVRVGRQLLERRSPTLYLPKDADPAFERLSAGDMRGRLLISDDDLFSYMAILYTPLRAWYSHPYNTPAAVSRRDQLEQFFAGGEEPQEWAARNIVIVTNSADMPSHAPGLIARGYALVGHTGVLTILERGSRRGS